ncbi:MAG: glucan biosynthesis protein [Verrucomicrobia bacterium]|nr:glucan biosynthesis protein [Verrucomicrobiota bacterium]
MSVHKTIPLLIFLVFGLGSESRALADYAKKETHFEGVVQLAKRLSEKPFKAPKSRLPDAVRDLDYDGYRKIIWRPDKSLWKDDDLNFRLEFFHPGYLFKNPVKLNEFSDSHVQTIPFTSEFFDYGDLDLNPRRISRQAYYAGFRLLFPLNEGDKFDEVLSFLGASYFRALGVGHRYGKSARGLALNTGLNQPEEFPIFREFWIGKPDYQSVDVRLFGLLDSPSVAGAYQFDVRPGKDTLIEVKAVLFFRQTVDWLGICPLTSMYWYGENSSGNHQDFRPEVHDSDGLMIEAEEGTIWRALVNDGRKRNFVHEGAGIRRFGLMQRDRNFDHYQDLEAWYQARPSVWIEPKEGMAAGSIQLIEFPTDNEYFDNIVAAWVPDEMPALESPYPVAYSLHWSSDNVTAAPLARVVSTRFGKNQDGQSGTRFVVEFTQPANQTEWLPDSIKADFTGSNPASITGVKVLHNSLDSRWRIVFLVQGSAPADLACRLLYEGELISEIWSYPWNPN